MISFSKSFASRILRRVIFWCFFVGIVSNVSLLFIAIVLQNISCFNLLGYFQTFPYSAMKFSCSIYLHFVLCVLLMNLAAILNKNVIPSKVLSFTFTACTGIFFRNFLNAEFNFMEYILPTTFAAVALMSQKNCLKFFHMNLFPSVVATEVAYIFINNLTYSSFLSLKIAGIISAVKLASLFLPSMVIFSKLNSISDFYHYAIVCFISSVFTISTIKTMNDSLLYLLSYPMDFEKLHLQISNLGGMCSQQFLITAITTRWISGEEFHSHTSTSTTTDVHVTTINRDAARPIQFGADTLKTSHVHSVGDTSSVDIASVRPKWAETMENHTKDSMRRMNAVVPNMFGAPTVPLLRTAVTTNDDSLAYWWMSRLVIQKNPVVKISDGDNSTNGMRGMQGDKAAEGWLVDTLANGLAIQDFARMCRCSPRRRLLLLQAASPLPFTGVSSAGGGLSSLLSSLCAMLAATSSQLQLCVAHLRVELLGVPNNTSTSIEPVRASAIEETALCIAKLGKSARETSTVGYIVKTILARNSLLGLHSFLRIIVGAVVRPDPFSAVHCQCVVDAVQGISLLFVHALQEDSADVTAVHLPTVVAALLDLRLALELHADTIRLCAQKQPHSTRSGGMAALRQRQDHAMTAPNMGAMATATEEALIRLFTCYVDVLPGYTFSSKHMVEVRKLMVAFSIS